jgi:putative membrane protein
MFIDYVALMLVNLVAGFLLLALNFAKYLEKDPKALVPGFLVVGFVATITGLGMIFTWPLPGSYNVPFGELSVLFGVLFLGAGIALVKEWNLIALGVYAVLAGAAAVIVGVRILNLKMTNEPALSGLGFILSGLSGFMTLPVYVYKKNKAVRIIAIAILLAAAAIWAFTGYASYWAHLQSFGKWAPPAMQAAPK